MNIYGTCNRCGKNIKVLRDNNSGGISLEDHECITIIETFKDISTYEPFIVTLNGKIIERNKNNVPTGR